MPIRALLPIYVVHVSLRFNEKTQLKSLHSPSLSAFIRYLAGSPERFDEWIKIDAPESGRCEYLIGDAYHFTLYGLKGSQELLKQLLQALQQLPFSAVKQDKKMPFRNNLTFDGLQDAFTGLPIKQFSQLTPYTLYDLQRDCQQWQGVSYFRLQLLSPIRLLKEKTARENCKGEARYCQQLSDLSGDLLSNRLYDYFAALIQKQGIELPARNQAATLNIEPNSHVFWLNASYTDSVAKDHVMGGMMGELFFSINEPEQLDWTLWLLGQYTGFGQRTAFGFGRYLLENVAGESTHERMTSSHSLLTTIGTTDNLIAALEHIQNNRDEAIEEPSEEEDEILLERLANDIDKLLNQNFTPPSLQGFLIENPDESPRPLAVPPFRDRVLQRAVAQVLQPIVDELHYQHSYGYRIGRSRINACYAIQAAWREGYHWVYESDIEDFFDSVDWQRLRVRLQGLWNDERLIHALMQWMQAPVDYQGERIERTQGLPQGSPLSPLLANIMLDDFDNDMQLAGFKLVRFADDFVVLCKSKEQAELAHRTALASLQEHGLKLNADKTHISNMADGFYYLGYLFVNDLALESPKRLRKQHADKSISKLSWFSQIIAREPNAINNINTCEVLKTSQVSTNSTPQAETIKMTASPSKDWQSSTDTAQQYGERDQQGLLLCITGDSCVLRTHEQHLQVEREQQTLYHLPWQQLQAVLLLGNHHITTPALQDAMQHNIPLHFASQTGKYQGVVWNGQAGAKGSALWLRQQQILAHPQYALILSQEIVGARLVNSAETLRLRNKTDAQQQINALIEKLPTAQNQAELNGLEGMGARYYFAALKELLPDEFGFNDRNRQPPLDPFNALLSLGFSLLYSCLESILRTDGLLPWQGFYHQPHGKHATLASDLMEPFRHLVERLALTLIKRRELKLNDFYITEQQACYLQKQARNFYLSQLMAKLEEKNAFELMHQQNLSLIRFIEQGENFKAWRVR
jgi:group II intron reverse transcriptase/maturase/CRISPR-associated endonuclease Cas1